MTRARHRRLADGHPTRNNTETIARATLYASSILALIADRAKALARSIHPHEMWEWDATQNRCRDAHWQGGHASSCCTRTARVFYVFESSRRRAAPGEAVRAEPDWRKASTDTASSKLRQERPSGTRVSSRMGRPTGFSSSTRDGLTMADVRECSIDTKSAQGEWESGKSTRAGPAHRARPRSQRICGRRRGTG